MNTINQENLRTMHLPQPQKNLMYYSQHCRKFDKLPGDVEFLVSDRHLSKGDSSEESSVFHLQSQCLVKDENV